MPSEETTAGADAVRYCLVRLRKPDQGLVALKHVSSRLFRIVRVRVAVLFPSRPNREVFTYLLTPLPHVSPPTPRFPQTTELQAVASCDMLRPNQGVLRGVLETATGPAIGKTRHGQAVETRARHGGRD